MHDALIDESLRAALASRFQILSVLGRGAMATVYLAHEMPRDRYVALKVLATSHRGTLAADRFRREARVLTTFRHPNILRALDAGTEGNYDWYSMPFVSGESLRERLDRERRLPIEEACRVASDVLAALAHSHASDIVHRDVKPDNVLLGADRALLADFGIARRVERPDSSTPTVATAHGVTLGTPAYMSPEQVAAERSIDGRSDVYSAAVLLYECLSGTLPITGRSARDFMARHMSEAPVPLSWVAPDVPLPIAEAVHRGLAKAPGDRFDSASAFREALSDALGRCPPDQRAAYGVPAVVVSPFAFSGLPQDCWIARGLWEAIVVGLQKGGTRVVDNRGRGEPATGRWHVSGRCDVSNGEVRITQVVVDRVRGSSQTLDPIAGQAADFLALQREAARHVRRALASDGLSSDQPPDVDDGRVPLAEALYLRGCTVARDGGQQTLSEASTYFARALQQAPHHVRALEAQAAALLRLASPGDTEALRRVITCAERALAIDATASAAPHHKGVALARLGEWTAAIDYLERAVAADPERPEAHYALGRCRLLKALCTPVWEHVGRAVRPLTRAIALDPGHLPSYRDLAVAHLYAGDEEQAALVLRAAASAAQSTPPQALIPASGLEVLRGALPVNREGNDATVPLLTIVSGADVQREDLSDPSLFVPVCCAREPSDSARVSPTFVRYSRHPGRALDTVDADRPD